MTLIIAFVTAGLAARACRILPELSIVAIGLAVLGGVALFVISGGVL